MDGKSDALDMSEEKRKKEGRTEREAEVMKVGKRRVNIFEVIQKRYAKVSGFYL